MTGRFLPLDDDTVAISRISQFVISLDGFVQRLTDRNPHDPRLGDLSSTLVEARLLLARAVSAPAE